MIPLDESFMQEALAQAKQAIEHGEVPVGCVVVHDGAVIARAHNRRETWQDPTAHAEMIALREAARKLGRWRLTGTTLYVTVEPCAMCAGAVMLARVDRLVYGCPDPKAGACGSVFNMVRESQLNHQVKVVGRVLAEDCSQVLKEFFGQRRNESL